MERKVDSFLIYGATGYTGGLIARTAAAQGHHPSWLAGAPLPWRGSHASWDWSTACLPSITLRRCAKGFMAQRRSYTVLAPSRTLRRRGNNPGLDNARGSVAKGRTPRGGVSGV
jgi:hypothetical protein